MQGPISSGQNRRKRFTYGVLSEGSASPLAQRRMFWNESNKKLGEGWIRVQTAKNSENRGGDFYFLFKERESHQRL